MAARQRAPWPSQAQFCCGWRHGERFTLLTHAEIGSNLCSVGSTAACGLVTYSHPDSREECPGRRQDIVTTWLQPQTQF